MTIAFVTSPLDRAHQLRKDSAALAAFRGNPASKLVKIQGDSVAMRNGDLDVAHQGIPADAVFLGQDLQNQAWFAATVPESASLVSIRALMIESAMPPDTVSILAQARSLAGWHARHGFCANCGSATTALDGGYRRHCANCATDHFPRTDPVVIMAVRHGDNFLLGRQASWPTHLIPRWPDLWNPVKRLSRRYAVKYLRKRQFGLARSVILPASLGRTRQA
jgi:NAD+ diphosphatase